MRGQEFNEALARGRARVWSYEAKLTSEIEAMLKREAGAMARRFVQKAKLPLTSSAAEIEKTSTMVAVYPSVEQQAALAVEGGQAADTIHCTLAFLGDTTESEFEALRRAIWNVAAGQKGKLQGVVGGVASFAAGPDGHPSIVLPDVPGLAELRHEVAQACADAGFDVASNHGWTPHLTLDYTPEPSPPDESKLQLPLTFAYLSVTRGDVMRDDMPLSGVVTSSGNIPEWSKPHPDEIVDADKLAAKVAAAIEPYRTRAIVAFGREMPTSVPAGGPGTVTPPALTAARKPKQVEGQVELSWDVTSPFVGKTLARTGEHIGAISRTTRADVMDVVQGAYEDGLSARDAAGLIRDSIGDSFARAQTIARTELTRLANGASFNATQIVGDATGVNYDKRWLTAPGAPHPRHELDPELDGQTVGIDEPFNVNGSELMYPGDPDGDPGETINCRCTVIYPETGEEIDAESLLAAAGVASRLNPKEERSMGNALVEGADESLEDAGTMPCASCDHAMDSHEGDGMGACSVQDCACESYVDPSKSDDNEDEAVTAASDVELPAELQPGSTATVPAPGPELPVGGSSAQWEAILCPEGKATEDGRIMAPGSISWRTLPLSLMAMTETSEGGHVGAELCGRIDSVWRDQGDRMSFIMGSGVFDSGDYGSEISRLVGDETLRGNSVDLAIREFEVGPRETYVDEDGYWIGPDEAPEGGPDLLDLLFGAEGDVLFVIRDAVIGMSTVCPFPAFEEATISLIASGDKRMLFRCEGDHTALRLRVYSDGATRLIVDDALTASAAGLVPDVPPAEWFEEPTFDALTPLTVTDDGRIYGHAWQWDSCHTGFRNRCVTAPHSETDYALFHLKEVLVDSGDRIPCGTITLDAPHAPHSASRKEAQAHYDDTAAAVADVRVGEDEFGGWIVGALRPDASAVSVRKLRGAVLSGDWREYDGNLELIGLLAVNIPGFPVPRQPVALVASGKDGDVVKTLISPGVVTRGTVGERDRALLLALGARAEGGLEGLASLAASSGEDCGCAS